MAITSRTAKGRADPAQSVVEADTDPLFRFMDFVFMEDDLAISPSSKHPALLFDNQNLPSPTPLADIINSYNSCRINATTQEKNVDSAGTRSHKYEQALGIVSTDVTVTKSAYKADDRTITMTAKPQDVLSVRGMGHSKNPGNMKFRELVNSKKRAYERNTCPEFRRSLAEDIVSEVLPGRFLKKADASEPFYQIMDYEASVTKALFAIRDVKMPSKRHTSGEMEGVVTIKKRKRKSSSRLN